MAENSLVPSLQEHTGLTEGQESRLNEIAALEERQTQLDEVALRSETQGTDMVPSGDGWSDNMVEQFFDDLTEDAGGYEADTLALEWGSAAGRNLALIHSFLSQHPEVEEALGDEPATAGQLRAGLALAEAFNAQPARKFKTVSLRQTSERQKPVANPQLQMRLNELIKRQADAQAVGDHELAAALEPIIQETAIAISGDEPIVGGYSPETGPRSV